MATVVASPSTDSEQLATAADYLAALASRTELQDNPDARLKLYRAACTTLTEQLTKKGDGGTADCAEGQAAEWLAVLLMGAQDAWSSIRRVSVDGVERFLAHLGGFSSSLSSPAPATESDDCERARFASFLKELLSQLQAAWTKAASTAWFAREGLLRVYKLIFRAHRCGGSHAVAPRQAQLGGLEELLLPWRREVLEMVALPALSDPQLPVREHAAELLRALITTTSPSADSAAKSALATFAASRVVAALQCACGAAHESSEAAVAFPTDEHHTRVTEGYLLAVVRLSATAAAEDSSSGVLRPWEEPLYGLLGRLAAHPASSVRQYVAEALGQPSGRLFLSLLTQLLDAAPSVASSAPPTPAPVAAGGTATVPWQTTETLLMALQQHLVRYLSQDASFTVKVDLLVEENGLGNATTPLALFGRSLAAVADCAEASVFEVARMGAQVVPLLLQFWVRFAPCADDVLLAVAEAMSDSATYKEQVAPAVWWFTALRAVTEESVATVDDNQSAAMAAKPLSTISAAVTRAWRAILDRCSAGDASLFAARLAIASYFSPERFSAEDACFYGEVAAPLLGDGGGGGGGSTDSARSLWAYALDAPKSRAAERLSWGLDFVHAPAVVAVSESLAALQTRALPLWMAALPRMLTHQQCILLCMARAVLAVVDDGSSGKGAGCVRNADGRNGGDRRRSDVSSSGLFSPFPTMHRPFSFVYRPGLFAAPVTLDGGEDVVLGFTWLKAFLPQEEDLPVPAVTMAPAATGVLPIASEAVLKGCRRIYTSREVVVEPVVLRETRSLLMALARHDRQAATQEAVVYMVLARLDSVLGAGWWTAAAEAGSEAAEVDKGSRGWDDWDDNDDGDAEEVGAVEGIASHEEIREAATMVKHLLRRHEHLATFAAASTEAAAEKLAFLLQH